MLGRALDVLAMLHDDAVVEHGHEGWGGKLGAVVARRLEDDVVDVPCAGRHAGVHQRRVLAVDCRRQAVGVGGIAEAVQHLHFVQAQQEDAAVAATLAVRRDLRRRAPLHMQLATAERFAGVDVAAARFHLHRVAGDEIPRRLTIVAPSPGVQAAAVEEHDGVGRRLASAFLGGERRRRHHRRGRAVDVVDAPLRLRQARRVGIALRQFADFVAHWLPLGVDDSSYRM